MKTIKELERYLEEEFFSFSQLTIGNHFAPEGFVVKIDGNEYIFGYSERGKLDTIKRFKTEKELVVYAQNKLEGDRWMKGHLVAWTWTEDEIKSAERELESMNILYERNDVPNYDLKHGRAYRIFVFGKDVKNLCEFIKKYCRT